MSDGMSDGRDYGPSLSKHGAPLLSQDGKPLNEHEQSCKTADDRATSAEDRIKDLERQLIEERKRCAEISSYYNDPKKIEELILSGAVAGEWKDWREKMQQKLQPSYIGHCYVGHCSYFVDRRCICLCAKCDEAKKADH